MAEDDGEEKSSVRESSFPVCASGVRDDDTRRPARSDSIFPGLPEGSAKCTVTGEQRAVGGPFAQCFPKFVTAGPDCPGHAGGPFPSCSRSRSADRFLREGTRYSANSFVRPAAALLARERISMRTARNARRNS